MLNAVILFAASSYFAWYMERFEHEMVYPFDSAYSTPQDAGEDRLTENRIRMSDGTGLVLWRAEPTPGKPVILYLPGNAGSLKDRAPRFTRLMDNGYGVVAVAYRGSSGSEGKPDEEVLTADARAVAHSVGEGPLILYGESLGTALAVKLAAEGVGDAIILEAPFTSISDILKAQYPSEELGHLLTQKWESVRIARDVVQPALVIHGSHDKIVPIDLGRIMFDSVGSSEKKFLEVTDRGHRELWTTEMEMELFAFLAAR